jgi:hypothetical protein
MSEILHHTLMQRTYPHTSVASLILREMQRLPQAKSKKGLRLSLKQRVWSSRNQTRAAITIFGQKAELRTVSESNREIHNVLNSE